MQHYRLHAASVRVVCSQRRLRSQRLVKILRFQLLGRVEECTRVRLTRTTEGRTIVRTMRSRLRAAFVVVELE